MSIFFLVNFRLRADHDVEGHSVGGLRPLLGPLWAVLDGCRGLGGRFWAAIGASVGGLGLSSGVCGRYWVAVAASVGNLGLSSGVCGRSWAALGPKSGPNPSGKAFLGRRWKSIVFWLPAARTHFFFRYSYL